MSLASEQFSQPLLTSVFLDSGSSHGALTQILLELSQCEAIGNGNVERATAHITQSVVKHLAASSCHIWLYSCDLTHLQQVASSPSLHPPATDITAADYPDYFQQLSQRQQPTTQGEAFAAKENQLPPYLQTQSASIAAFLEVPIYYQNQIAGIICCTQEHAPRVWQASEKSFLITTACLMALTLSQAQQQQQLQDLKKQKRQLSLVMIEQQQAEHAWQESQRFIRGILDASANILYVNDFSSGTNYYVNGFMEHTLGYSPQDVQQLGVQFLEKIAHPKDITAIHQARQKLAQSSSGNIVENEYRLQHKQGSWHWMLCRETIFQWDTDGTPLQLLGTATDITVHKENAEALQQQNQALTELAMVDSLTQIANRRAFDNVLHNAWAARDHTPLTLILCDIDYFKRYNDTYGHQQGDECLKLVAQALKKAVKRQLDLVARYGGEEFAIVLPNTALPGAMHVAQTIQHHVRALKIEHRHSEIGPYLTMSLGIATVSSTAYGSHQEIIAAADRGLYQAKAEGRGRFSIGQTSAPNSSPD